MGFFDRFKKKEEKDNVREDIKLLRNRVEEILERIRKLNVGIENSKAIEEFNSLLKENDNFHEEFTYDKIFDDNYMNKIDNLRNINVCLLIIEGKLDKKEQQNLLEKLNKISSNSYNKLIEIHSANNRNNEEKSKMYNELINNAVSNNPSNTESSEKNNNYSKEESEERIRKVEIMQGIIMDLLEMIKEIYPNLDDKGSTEKLDELLTSNSHGIEGITCKKFLNDDYMLSFNHDQLKKYIFPLITDATKKLQEQKTIKKVSDSIVYCSKQTNSNILAMDFKKDYDFLQDIFEGRENSSTIDISKYDKIYEIAIVCFSKEKLKLDTYSTSNLLLSDLEDSLLKYGMKYLKEMSEKKFDSLYDVVKEIYDLNKNNNQSISNGPKK